MTKKQRIIRFITYYKCQLKTDKGIIKESICAKCNYKGSTFTYKFNNKNFSMSEVEAIEEIIQNHKYGNA